MPISTASAYNSTSPAARPPFWKTLYFRVLLAIVLGALAGFLFPAFGTAMKPVADGFVKLIRMLIAPIIFLTVVSGIGGVGDMKKLGRMGLKALLYFEVVTTLALGIGMAVAALVQPGRGMNVDPKTLDTKPIAQYTAEGAHLSGVDFLLNIIPDSFVGAFAKGEILQVLLLAVLCGIALTMLRGTDTRLAGALQSLSHLFFKVVGIVMEVAPLGAFAAMAFTVGKYGIHTLLQLGKLMAAVYITSIAFVAVVLGLIALAAGINLWKLIVYLKGELLIVLGTSSSEAALPRLMLKMEQLGCSKAVTGLVIPAGYSFNLDGTSIYLTIAALFLAQAMNIHLSLKQQLLLLGVLMLNSKGAAAVTGGGFITLAATLGALGTVPVAGIALILGVDRFMSEMRALTNLVGNSVATIVVARWEGQFDQARAAAVLDGRVYVPEGALELTDEPA